MSRSIVIGDVHGCYYTLMQLLDKVNYDQSSDHLYFLGDLIGKGPHSDKVMDFILSLNKVNVTLGNHDIFWMHRYYHGSWGSRPDFDALEEYRHKDRWLAFYKQQQLLIEKDFGVMVHASVYKDWTIQEARDINDEIMKHLRDDTESFLLSMYNERPKSYDADNEIARLRANMYVLIECRHYQDDAFISFAGRPEDTEGKPWYKFDRKIKKPIIFGHWAALRGRDIPDVIPLDGGAVYGGKLMALIGETEERFSVDRDDDDK